MSLLTLALLSQGCFRSIVFPRTQVSAEEIAALESDKLEVVTHETDDGERLTGLVTRGDEGGPIVVYAAGNGMSLLASASILEALRGSGYGEARVFAYRGYDTSSGEPDSETAERDLVEILEAVRTTRPNRCLIGIGQSLGTGLLLRASLRTEDAAPNAIVLLSPYTSMSSVFHDTVPGSGWLVADSIDATEAARSFDGPLLIIHGQRDTLIPIDHGRELAQVAQNAELIELPARAHNDLWKAPTPIPEFIAERWPEWCQK